MKTSTEMLVEIMLKHQLIDIKIAYDALKIDEYQRKKLFNAGRAGLVSFDEYMELFRSDSL